MNQQSAEVLLVEDEKVDVKLIKKAFADIDSAVHVTVASDGQSALEYLRKRGAESGAPRVDLVLLDINMPKVSGHEVLAELKRDPGLRKMIVIMLSSSEDQNDINLSYKLGANGYVCKPSDLSETTKAVESICAFWFSTASLPTH